VPEEDQDEEDPTSSPGEQVEEGRAAEKPTERKKPMSSKARDSERAKALSIGEYQMVLFVRKWSSVW
jgi:ABC-type molybdenum transport system ATPase subunit/photorepair protein PhrA